jgi:hypothetical protein
VLPLSSTYTVQQRKLISAFPLIRLTKNSPYVPPVLNSRLGMGYPSTRPSLPTIHSDAASGQQTPRVSLPAPSEIKAEGGVALDAEEVKPRPASVHSSRSSHAGGSDATTSDRK